MPERVDARDVLDANAVIGRTVTATIVGHFQRTGPNSWDDYQFVRDDPAAIELVPGVQVQLERYGTDFRTRASGRVFRVRWTPGPDDPEELESRSRSDRREYFVRTYLAQYDDAPGMGAAAVIAGKLGK